MWMLIRYWIVMRILSTIKFLRKNGFEYYWNQGPIIRTACHCWGKPLVHPFSIMSDTVILWSYDSDHIDTHNKAAIFSRGCQGQQGRTCCYHGMKRWTVFHDGKLCLKVLLYNNSSWGAIFILVAWWVGQCVIVCVLYSLVLGPDSMDGRNGRKLTEICADIFYTS